MATVASDMASSTKPLETGDSGGCVMDYYSPGGNELEKPFLTPSGLDNNSRLERRDMKLKQRIRYLKFLSRLLSFMMSCVVVGMMVNTIVTYFTSKDTTRGGVTPWPTDPKIWPTLMMLGVAGLGLFSNAVVIIAYLCGQKAANSASSVASLFSVLNMVAHLVIWAVAAGVFKQQNAANGIENDLWSWSCSTTADARAATFVEVNYGFLCTTNFSSWYISLANVGLGILTLTLYMLAIWRLNNKKKIREAQAAGGNMPA